MLRRASGLDQGLWLMYRVRLSSHKVHCVHTLGYNVDTDRAALNHHSLTHSLTDRAALNHHSLTHSLIGQR